LPACYVINPGLGAEGALDAAPRRVVEVAHDGEVAGQALRIGLETMTEHDLEKPAKPLLLGATPQLFVADLPASCDFFGETLGFTVEFTYGEPPFYGQVARDGARLALRRVDRPILAGINAAMAAEPDMLAAALSVDDVQALYQDSKQTAHCFTRRCAPKPGARAPSSSATPTATCCCSRAAQPSRASRSRR
jgi:Glyoxalase/Bleomycin resistance protein/Dioxygenase superfamily